MPPRKKTTMSDSHKAALAEGRMQSKAVRDYLEALEAHKPKRGRKRTPDSIKKQLAAVEESLAGATAAKRLDLIQQRRDLEQELVALQSVGVDISALEKAFTKVAKAYGARKGIAYATWREFGVPADVLKRAGITRGS